MNGYGQFCPVAKAAEIFCERWTPLILRDLAFGASRFNELQRGVPLASPTILSRRLKQLEAEGIVERRKAGSGRGWTYHLTAAGKEFTPLVIALGEWGQRWSRRTLAAHEVDLGLLLWALERGAKPRAFGPGRTVVELEFTDQPDNKRRWWFLNESNHCELCLERPDRDAALYLATTLPDMIRVWRGDLTLSRALERDVLHCHGSADVMRALPDWLGISPLAHVTQHTPADYADHSAASASAG